MIPTRTLPDTPRWWRSAEGWETAFFLLMLFSGYLSIAVSQAALGAALLVRLWRWRSSGARPPRTGLEWPAILLAGWALLMVPLSTDVSVSALYYRRFYLFTALWLGAGLAGTESRRRLLLWAVLGGALAISLYGQIVHIIRYGGVLHARLAEIFNSMTSGALLMMAALLAAGVVAARGPGRRMKLAAVVAVLPVLLGLVMTLTRSAQLGLVGGIATILLLRRARVFWVFAAGVAVLAAAVLLFGQDLLPGALWKRLDPSYLLFGESTQARVEMWRGGWEMIKAHPLTGVGDRGLAEIAPRYYTSPDGTYWGHLHSNIVHMAVIWGIPGLILGHAFLGAQFVALMRRWRRIRRLDPSSGGVAMAQAWTLGAIGAWVGFSIAGLTEWYFGDAESMLIFLAIVGCGLGTRFDEANTAPDVL